MVGSDNGCNTLKQRPFLQLWLKRVKESSQILRNEAWKRIFSQPQKSNTIQETKHSVKRLSGSDYGLGKVQRLQEKLMDIMHYKSELKLVILCQFLKWKYFSCPASVHHASCVFFFVCYLLSCCCVRSLQYYFIQMMLFHFFLKFHKN